MAENRLSLYLFGECVVCAILLPMRVVGGVLAQWACTVGKLSLDLPFLGCPKGGS
jgi:hypothetical protein